MSGASPPILELDRVTKRFGSTEAVAGVSGSFARGEYVCILGPSGCGKTTLLRMVAGFEEPSSGTISLDGRSLASVPPERRDVNVVFQSYALFPHMSVASNVAFGPRMKRLPAAEVESRVREALRLVRLEGQGDRSPRQLSGGQQQRVALARALANRPRVLLLDEPLSALDRSLRLEMQEELRALQRETRVTFFHVTHDQGEALSLADRLVVMRGGRFEQVGPPRELYHRPGSRFVAEFLGSANLLAGTLAEGGVVRTADGLALRVQDTGGRAPGEVLLSVRPEAIALEPSPPAGEEPDSPNGTNRFPGSVEETSFTGAVLECRVRVGGQLLRVQASGRQDPRELGAGSPVTVRIPPSEVVLLPVEAEGL